MTDRVMTILFLNISANLGGAERSLLAEAGALSQRGVRSFAGLFHEGPLTEKMEAVGVRCVPFRMSGLLRSLTRERSGLAVILLSPLLLLELVVTGMRIIAFARKNKVDLIVSNSFKIHFMTAVIRLLDKRPIVWRYRDRLPDNAWLRSCVVFLARWVPGKILANSFYIKDQLAKSGVSLEKLGVVYPAFYPRDYVCSPDERKAFRREYGLGQEDFAVGALGVLVYWKGQSCLIRAAKLLVGRIPCLKVLIVGSHIYDTDSKDTGGELALLVRELELEGTVRFFSFAAENRRVLNALDMIAHTPVRPEPFGRVAVEGLLCQKPVVVADVGGLPEIVRDGETGCLVPPEDPAALAEAVFGLYQDKERARMMAQAGYEDVKTRFDQERIAADVLSIYKAVAGQV